MLDTAAVALFIAAITNVALNTSSGTIRSYTLAADGALGLTALASAIYGYYYVAECRQQDPQSRFLDRILHRNRPMAGIP